MVAGRPDVLPGIYQRGMERRTPEFADTLQQTRVEQAQYMTPVKEQPIAPTLTPGTRRVRVFPRGDVPVQAQWFPNPQTNQWIAVVDQGVNLIVDGLKGFGSIDVSADRLVIWTTGSHEPDLTGQIGQDERTPMEIYLEGNVVFLQGTRKIHASRMYYDVTNHVGTVLDADVLTPAPEVRRARAIARRDPSADGRGPLLRAERLRHAQPHGDAQLSHPVGQRDVRRPPGPGRRSGHGPTAVRPRGPASR